MKHEERTSRRLVGADLRARARAERSGVALTSAMWDPHAERRGHAGCSVWMARAVFCAFRPLAP